MANGTFTIDYKTSDVTQIYQLNLQDWSTASNTVVTFLTGAGSYVLTADGTWHTLIVGFNADWEAGVMGVDFQLIDNLNPRIVFQFGGTGGTILLDNFVYNAAPPVAVTEVTLDQPTLALAPTETATLVRTVAPVNASNQIVTWSSSNSNIASIVAGVVTAVAEGTCDITVTTTDGGFTDICAVTVTPVSVTGVTLNKQQL